MSKLYGVRPSEIMALREPYDAYCFDEAVAHIIARIKEGEKPKFKSKDKGKIKKTHFSKMSDLYGSMGFDKNSYTKINDK